MMGTYCFKLCVVFSKLPELNESKTEIGDYQIDILYLLKGPSDHGPDQQTTI